ncbi:MAG: hypothetical protein QXP70_02195 [Methanomassiliicoccales archaeon]
MGRTVPTFRNEMERIIERWERFGKALRREERQYLERVIEKARKHSDAASYAALQNPLECMLLSILVEQEIEMDLMRRRGQNERMDP